MSTNKTVYSSAKKTILVVEDDAFYANICKMKLTKEGYNVVIMANGAWAIKSLETQRPDLLLLDLVMPETDGFEVLKSIKNNPKLRPMKIIVFSNLSQPEDVKKAKELGVDDYFIKTAISLQDMVKKIRSALS